MQRRISWKPDTCLCTVVYTYNDALPVEEQVFSVAEFPAKCDAHSKLSDQDAYAAIVREQLAKNLPDATAEQLAEIEASHDGVTLTDNG